MAKEELLSKEWCNLIFQGRNKDYGAYVLRKNTGRRYAIALGMVFSALLLFTLLAVATGLYVRSVVRDTVEEMQTVVRFKSLDTRDGYERKAISAGRRAVPQMKPGATMSKPEIADEATQQKPLGIDGPATTDAEIASTLADLDTLHNAGRTDLPIEGAQLTPTQIVEEMPEFPGGVAAFMRWLDANVQYPEDCVKKKVEGDVEVSFIVDAKGSVLQPEIVKRAHPRLDSAAIATIERMPRWKPGRQNGRITAVRITVPIHFQVH